MKERQHVHFPSSYLLASHTKLGLQKVPIKIYFNTVQFSSLAQLCLTLCDPMDCSTPGLPIHHQLQEFTQIHVHWVCDAIQPSHPLSSPSPPAHNLSQHQGLFKWVSSLHQVAKILEFQLQHQSLQWTPRTDLLCWQSKRSLYTAKLILILIRSSISSVQSLSQVQLFVTPWNCSTPGLPVHHQLPEFTQTHFHQVSDAIQPSHPLSSPSPPAANPSQHQSLFQWVNSSHEVAKVLEFQL